MAFTRRYRKNLKGGKRRRKRKTIRKRRNKRRNKRKTNKRGGAKMRLTKMKRNLTYLGKKVKKLQKGGGLLAQGTFKCNYPPSIGQHFTGYKLNTNPFLPDPQNNNSNTRVEQKGGGFFDDIGLGDALLGWYKGTNTIKNIPIRYQGGKPVMPADPMHQPKLLANRYVHTTANVPQMYNSSSETAIKNTIQGL